MSFNFDLRSQFKAHGVDDKVFKPPVLPAKKGVKSTIIEPFHLTESHKKEVNIASRIFFCLRLYTM